MLVANETFHGTHVKDGPTKGFSQALHALRRLGRNYVSSRSRVRLRAWKGFTPSRKGLSSVGGGRLYANESRENGGSTLNTSVCEPLRVMASSTLFTGVRISPKNGSLDSGKTSTGPKLCIFRLYMVENASLNTWCLPTWVDIILLLGLPGPGIGYSVALCEPGTWSLVTRIISLLL